MRWSINRPVRVGPHHRHAGIFGETDTVRGTLAAREREDRVGVVAAAGDEDTHGQLLGGGP